MRAALTALCSRRDRMVRRPLSKRKVNVNIFGAYTAVPLDQGKRVCVLVYTLFFLTLQRVT